MEFAKGAAWGERRWKDTCHWVMLQKPIVRAVRCQQLSITSQREPLARADQSARGERCLGAAGGIDSNDGIRALITHEYGAVRRNL